jgi:hypothetical protein
MRITAKMFAPALLRPPFVVEPRPWVMVYEARVTPKWELYEEERREDGFVVRVMKLVRADHVLVLTAKDFVSLNRESMRDLRTRDWLGRYEQIFDVTTSLALSETEQVLMDRVVPALDVVAEGTIQNVKHRTRERYAHVCGHGLIVTATGLRSAHDLFAADIERWFTNVGFRRSR